MLNRISINRERILAAAKKCPTASGVLKELFPEVFEEEMLSPEKFGFNQSFDYDNGVAIIYRPHAGESTLIGYVVRTTSDHGRYGTKSIKLHNNLALIAYRPIEED